MGSEVVTVRIPRELLKRLDEAVIELSAKKRRRLTRSDLIREAIEKLLGEVG